jgi:superfamily II DNA or RNA helicase
VYATRFVSRKTGKQGYAPACSNKWVRSVCGLPNVRCAECPTPAFVPVTKETIRDHLMGHHVVGVYPLLEDDTCWFLAIDFDKSTWKDDVAAVVETCRTIGIEPSVERSRSGNGAHVWFFFAAPVSASSARALGCHLITETATRRHQLSMESYDRLFPNQDTLPRGGFGNRIALPLQREARQQKNTVFVNDQFTPYADQWAYLASVPRLDPTRVSAIVRDAAQNGQVLGVRHAEHEQEDVGPWMQQTAELPHGAKLLKPLPTNVRAVLGQRLFIEKTGLTPAFINHITRLAAFQNPEFYKKQRLRLSTALTPRIISCAEDFSEHIALPRGCLVDLERLLGELGIALSIDDKRQDGEPVEFRFVGELTALQERAAVALLPYETGIMVAPPGIGKTVLGTRMVAARGRSTLVLVHRQPLLEQWIAQLAMFLGLHEKDVGRIGGGRRKPNGRLDVAMIQSLVRSGSGDDLVAGYGHVVVDECHHVPAVSFERVLSNARAKYILGLTATPHRRDGHHPIARMQLGPVRFSVDHKSQSARRPFTHRVVVRQTDFRLSPAAVDTSIQGIYRALADDEARNTLIIDDVIAAVHRGRSPIVLSERRDHLEGLAEQLGKMVRHVFLLTGGKAAKQRRELAARLAQIRDDEERLVLATGRYIGEGFDDARLDTLFLALPVSWKGTLVQYAGRLHRTHAAKTNVAVYDYVDRETPMLLRMFEKRLRTYRAMGYTVRGVRSLDGGAPEAPTLDWDDDNLPDIRIEVR